ncbi:small VCP/p97-interacting protein domain-containing protein [Phthorimaea operculella]|nr:small VCP/p97-interacting protein domain-containing protein [Phthorimaea operculella]
MGIFASCCKPSAADVPTPDAETRRQQLVQAAEARRQAEAARGVKDPSKITRMQQKSEEMEKRQAQLEREGGASLKWTAN